MSARNTFTSRSARSEDVMAIRLLASKQQVIFACDCALMALPIWEAYDKEDKRPHNAIQAAIRGVLATDAYAAAAAAYATNAHVAASAADAAAAAYATDAHAAAAAHAAAHAAYAAYATNAAVHAGYAASHASHAADAADAAWNGIFAYYQQAMNDRKQFPERWKTNNTRHIAKVIVKNILIEDMPILADALEDVGFDDTTILARLRNKTAGISDWVIYNLLT